MKLLSPAKVKVTSVLPSSAGVYRVFAHQTVTTATSGQSPSMGKPLFVISDPVSDAV